MKRPKHKQWHDRPPDERDNVVSLASRRRTEETLRARETGARQPAAASMNDDDETGPPAA